MIRILHIDLDAFFASVEIAESPSLLNEKVVVMGAGERGVVTSANYKARASGVKAGMPFKKAFKLCPDCKFLPANYHLYEEYSRRFFKVLESFSPDIEHYSIDEAFMDISRLRFLYSSEIELAEKIKKKILKEVGISSSIGIAEKKVSAKIATKLAKPGGICKVTDEDEFMREVVISEIPGIGKALTSKFSLLGFQRGQDIEERDFILWEKIKTGFGAFVIPYERKVLKDLPFLSVSRGRTFDEDLSDKNKILSYLSQFAEDISESLTKNRVKASLVGIRIRYFNFYEEEFKVKVTPPVSNYSDIFYEGKRLFLEGYNPLKGKVRAITLFAGNVKKAPLTYLFHDKLNKREKFSSVVFKIKKRYGKNKIIPARRLL